jgi:hypothetical protein
MIGWSKNLEYLGRAFGGLAQFVGIEMPRRAAVWEISHLDSISITSAFSRLAAALGHGTGTTLALTLLGAGGCLGLAWWMYGRHGFDFWGWPEGRSGRPARGLVASAEWMGLMVATVAFSPQTLKRHMFLMVPVYAMTAAFVTARRRYRNPQGWSVRAGLAGKSVVLAGLLLSLLAISLPPRWEGNESWSDAWRTIGGPSWGLLILFFALLWTALQQERARPPDPVPTEEARPERP